MQKSILTFILFVVVSFIFTTVNLSWAQSSSNPFEIKPRLKDLPTTSQKNVDNMEMESNTVSIGDNEDQSRQISSQHQLTLKSDTTNTVKQKNQKESNPFEVDHVPLRKTAVAKQSIPTSKINISEEQNNNFLFWYLLLSTVLLAIVINTNYKSLSLAGKSITNDNVLKLFMREQVDSFSLSIVLLYLIFFINMAVFIFFTVQYKFSVFTELNFIFYIFFVLGYYLLKHGVLTLLGSIFEIEKYTSIYSFTIMVTNIIIGILLLPSNFIYTFSNAPFKNIAFIFILVFIGIILLIRVLRSLFIVSTQFFSYFFQIFIYLCAFEIAPLLIIAKFLLNLKG